MTDADRTRWLVGSPDQDRYLLCEPVRGHGLSGEPPRHILHADQDYALERRGQSSAAGVGMHGRPALPRVATYVYRAGPDHDPLARALGRPGAHGRRHLRLRPRRPLPPRLVSTDFATQLRAPSQR
jgi:hypothetical protein